MKTLKAFSLYLAGLLCAFSAYAQPAITSISASSQAGSEVVRVELSQPLTTVPPGFVVQSPARIALDFAGYVSSIGRSSVDLAQANLRSANVVQAGDRTRLVLNLKQNTGYRAQIQGSALLILLDPVPAASVVRDAPSTFAESRNAQLLPIKDVDFRRSADGAARVVVELGSNQVGVDIRQQGAALVVDFLKSSVSDNLRKRLDVADFGTPVNFISTTQSGDRVRMTIEPRGQWEHSAYQSDTQFVVEVRAVRADPGKLTQGVGFTGEKLSLNFQNIEVRQLLQVIADFTNFNIVTSDTVTGALTLRLRDVPWDQALEIILQTKGLGMRKSGNVIWVAPAAELAAKEKAELEAKASLQALEPLRSQSFQLNYTKATDVAAQLGSGASSGESRGRLLSTRGSVIAEPRTNQLFVTDVASRLEAIQDMIKKLDIAVRQVVIEARIVEADDKFGKSIGVRLGGADLRGVRGGDAGYAIGGGNRVAVGGSYAALDPTTGAGSASLDTANTTFFSLPAVGQGGYAPATFAASLFSAASNRFLNLELSALEADGRGKIVSSPRVVTADQVKALIEQGTELPYQIATSSGATSIAFRKANLKLEVTPQITPEGNIILDVDVNKDSVGRATAAGFAIDTKHVKTSVLVENGGTVVIGGIFELFERNEEAKVPFVGDLPFVGNLFKTKQKTVNKSEMLIFISPKVVAERAGAR